MDQIAIGNQLFITNPISEAVQELDIIFNTEYTELIGDTTFGSNFYMFLNSLHVNEYDIAEYVNMLITKFCSFTTEIQYEIDVNINYDEEAFDRTIQVLITLNDGLRDYSKTYNISNLLYID